MSVPALEALGAVVPFGRMPGLSGVSLQVERSERVALMGPSGVGKTSLLRAIAGLQPLAGGVMRVEGRDVTHLPPEARRVAYLHQSPTLFPHLSVIENVSFPAEVRGRTRRTAREAAAELLDRVHMADFALRRPHELSGGQAHRVALARALAAEPAVLLLDEPFASLDPALRDDVRDAVVATLKESDAPPTVFVTHDVDEAAIVGTRIVVLMAGGMAQDAAPAHLLARPASVAVARFLGIPNVVPGVGDGHWFTSPLGRHALHGRAGRGHLVLRATDLTVHCGDAPCSVTGRVLSVEPRVAGDVVRVDVDGLVITAVARPALRAGDLVRVGVNVAAPHVVFEGRPHDV